MNKPTRRISCDVPIDQDPIKTWERCGGYYNCPEDAAGNLLGPLVGYAGTYTTTSGQEEHFVGRAYYDFAAIEEHPHVLDHFASRIMMKLPCDLNFTAVLGAPMGGILLAGALARNLDCRMLFAEKKVTRVASAEAREESRLVMNRHQARFDDSIIIVEDVCNNFSTTEQLIYLATERGGSIVAIVCALNRSAVESYEGIPVFSYIHRETPQYRQDDPKVSSYVQAGKVIWKPKDHRDELQEIMRSAKS